LVRYSLRTDAAPSDVRASRPISPEPAMMRMFRTVDGDDFRCVPEGTWIAHWVHATPLDKLSPLYYRGQTRMGAIGGGYLAMPHGGTSCLVSRSMAARCVKRRLPCRPVIRAPAPRPRAGPVPSHPAPRRARRRRA